MTAVCIHGHFYQPPRESPLTGRIERQPSAAPFWDWNQRITAECYRPLLSAPILGPHGDVIDQVNCWEQVAFDVGPTLMRWMWDEARDVHDGIVAADRAAVARTGHGPAIAQGYHHAILPLASPEDRRTEIRWGLADFEARFRRPAEGIWLPETAVDTPTLIDLADEGLAFTVLAPHQAGVGEEVATDRAWQVPLPDGRTIAAFFYDGRPSRGVAFDRWLDNGEAMAHRLAGGSGLVHLATDGESYGHHHRHGEMALAYCLRTLEALGVPVVTHGGWLAEHPPIESMPIAEPSSWSCSHGVGRWSEDCGCGTEDGRWRPRLRAGLNRLRDAIDEWTIPRLGASGEDPWALRDQYVHTLLSESGIDTGADPLAGSKDVSIRGLLEIQRHRLMMFTSCGWFFADPRGIETQQILCYAKRAVDLLRDHGGPDLEELVPSVDALLA
jgi:alpha-amylase/alpha-mannosidase (GH57 family)